MKSKGRPKKFEREAILEKAMHVFWQQGFDASSISQLCDATCLKPPSLYAQFNDKANLFIEVLDYYHRGYHAFLKQLLTEEIPIADKIEKLLDMSAKDHTGDRKLGCLIANSATQGVHENPKVAAKIHYFHELNESLIAACIKKGIDEENIQTTLSAKLIARYINGILQGAAILSRGQQSSDAVNDLIKVSKLSIASLIQTRND